MFPVQQDGAPEDAELDDDILQEFFDDPAPAPTAAARNIQDKNRIQTEY